MFKAFVLRLCSRPIHNVFLRFIFIGFNYIHIYLKYICITVNYYIVLKLSTGFGPAAKDFFINEPLPVFLQNASY